jgi:UDP-glucose:(heptosyl)LPS alpha-1,3-glucosyltransferase
VDDLLRVTHIVRQFGRVGGMESYVYELSKALVDLGVDVHIVCECVHDELPGTTIHRVLSPEFSRPRWRAMLFFRDQVQRYILTHGENSFGVIHSHERTLNHHVTTFHGPPINMGFQFRLPRWLSPRVWAWADLERDELLSSRVSAVVPVSRMIGDLLVARYPKVASRLSLVGWPAPQQKSLSSDENRAQKVPAMCIGFVGREWKRKGLIRAHKICRQLSKLGYDVRLLVVGAHRPPRFLLRDPIVEIIEWSNDLPYWRMDALLHPASIEPYGMVIAEARAAGVPVVCSDVTGAKDHGFSGISVVPVNAPLSAWCEAIVERMSHQSDAEVLQTWPRLAENMTNNVYIPIWNRQFSHASTV